MKKWFLILLVLIGFLQSHAQLLEKNELEFELSNSFIDDRHLLIPLDSNGIVLLNFQESIFGKKSNLLISNYSKELIKNWEIKYTIAEQFGLHKIYKNEEFVFVLLVSNNDKIYSVIKIESKTGEFSLYESEFLTKMNIDFFAEIDNKYIFTGEYNDKPVAELHKIFDKSAKVLPDLYSNDTEITALEIHGKLIHLMLQDEKNCQFSMAVFNSEGKKVYIKKMGDNKKVILNAKILKYKDRNSILVGNYSDYCTDYSSGFFMTALNDSSEISYYPFSDLKNNLAHLSKKRQAYIQKRINIKKLKGKTINRRFRVNLQEPLVINENNIMIVAEVFYAEYKNIIYNYRSVMNGVSENFSTKQDFNNYRYTNAIICLLDINGNIQWDYSVNLGSLETAILSKKVQVSVTNDEYVIAYPKDDLIKISIVKKDEEVKYGVPVSLKNKESGNVSDVTVDLFSWYENNYLAYGYKTSRLNGDLGSKEFFYVKKLTYSPETKK